MMFCINGISKDLLAPTGQFIVYEETGKNIRQLIAENILCGFSKTFCTVATNKKNSLETLSDFQETQQVIQFLQKPLDPVQSMPH